MELLINLPESKKWVIEDLILKLQNGEIKMSEYMMLYAQAARSYFENKEQRGI